MKAVGFIRPGILVTWSFYHKCNLASLACSILILTFDLNETFSQPPNSSCHVYLMPTPQDLSQTACTSHEFGCYVDLSYVVSNRSS